MHIPIDQAVQRLKNGGVVAIPTETVYGLAAALHFQSAIAEIFALKGRPSNNPLIIHLAKSSEITNFVTSLPKDFEKLAAAFWPGPLTMILPVKGDKVVSIARAGLPTAAFRVPQHLLTREVLEQTGPLVMPSANLSGKPSATCAKHVEVDFGLHFPVLDGGECAQGLESTILFWNGSEECWAIVRLGALAPESFRPILGYIPEVLSGNKDKPICPGQLYRHYAPRAKLHLLRDIPLDFRGVLLGFDDRRYPVGCQVMSLGSSKNPEQAAQHLYAVLRDLDENLIQEASVDFDVPDYGLWQTLKERLRKASQK